MQENQQIRVTNHNIECAHLQIKIYLKIIHCGPRFSQYSRFKLGSHSL